MSNRLLTIGEAQQQALADIKALKEKYLQHFTKEETRLLMTINLWERQCKPIYRSALLKSFSKKLIESTFNKMRTLQENKTNISNNL